jgi:hypothetical protein
LPVRPGRFRFGFGTVRCGHGSTAVPDPKLLPDLMNGPQGRGYRAEFSFGCILEILKNGGLASTLLYLKGHIRDGYRGSQLNKQ